MTDARYSFVLERPWPAPSKSDCHFYHSFDFPDGEGVAGEWDIRGRFDQYIGGCPLSGKSVLDVGTATGFLSFNAEARGATVTAMDAHSASEYSRIPFQSTLFFKDWPSWEVATEASLKRLKNGFWYAWHKFNSKVEVVYTPLASLPHWQRRFDVVMAGAILEHLGDPVSGLGSIARLAKETVVVAFTDIGDTDDLIMRTVTPWTDPAFDYSFWVLSRGLYRRIFQNLGFEMEIVPVSAINCHKNPPPLVKRPTIVARRMR